MVYQKHEIFVSTKRSSQKFVLCHYEGKCLCGRRYIGETIRNSDIRWIEHESTTGKSEPAKHLADNKSHMFTWKVLASASLNFRKRKILEAFLVTKLKPDLNDQTEHHALSIF